MAGLAGATLLAACGAASPEEASDNAAASPFTAVADWVTGMSDRRPRILCAMTSGASLAQDCRVESGADDQGRVLILSRPDGGLRRLRIGADGELTAADGAVEAKTARSGSAIGVLFGDERYALPASLLGGTATR